MDEGRPPRGAAKPCESRALFRRHAQGGVEIEAFEVRLAGSWTVDVLTVQGQLIGRVWLVVTP